MSDDKNETFDAVAAWLRTIGLNPDQVEKTIKKIKNIAAMRAYTATDGPNAVFFKKNGPGHFVFGEAAAACSSNPGSAPASLLAETLQRDRDRKLLFVQVSGMDPRTAVQRVTKLKSEYVEVEPIDLTGVLDDVNPICELYVERLQNIMNLKKALNPDDDVPDEIRFVVPNVDLPAPSETDPSDLKLTMIRYVHFDSMPKELQQVVRSYLSMRRSDDTLAKNRFRKAVTELAQKTETTFNGSGPKVA